MQAGKGREPICKGQRRRGSGLALVQNVAQETKEVASHQAKANVPDPIMCCGRVLEILERYFCTTPGWPSGGQSQPWIQKAS